MKLSLSSFVFLNYPLHQAVVRIAKAGYDGVDIWGGRPHAYRTDMSAGQIRELAGTIRDLGLSVPSFIPAQFRYPTCLCSPNDKIRKESVGYIKEGLETAAELGAPIVSVCPGHSVFGQDREDASGRLSESLGNICEAAERLNLRVALEPADKYETDLVNTWSEAVELIEEVGATNLGVVLDNGHSHVVGEAADRVIPELGNRLFHVHVDDNNGLRDQHLIPGEGSFDCTPFVAARRKTSYEGFLTAELAWDYTLDPEKAALNARQRMKEMLEESHK